MLGGLIRYFVPGSGVTKFDAYMMAMGLSLCAMMLAVSHHPYFYGVQRIGMKLRIAACGLIYKKVVMPSLEIDLLVTLQVNAQMSRFFSLLLKHRMAMSSHSIYDLKS